MPATPARPDAASVKPAGKVINPGALHLDPRLLNTPLAAAWQRAGGMVVDLVLVGALSLLAHTVLGLLTGATLAALGTGQVSDTRFWRAFRWVLIGLGVGVMLLSGFLLLGRPLVRTSAFNLGQVPAAAATETVAVSPSAGTSELRRAVSQLETQVETLRQDNDRLRETARGNSLLNLVTDSSRTLGLTFGWAGVYFTLCTAWLGGRTLGKWLFGSRVVRLDGRPLTAMDAFTRNGGYAAGLATGSIGFLRLLWDPNHQAIQDKIAGTVVISSRNAPSPDSGSRPETAMAERIAVKSPDLDEGPTGT